MCSEHKIDPAELYGLQEDHFQRLWTPHRMVYVKEETPRGREGQVCPFCNAPKLDDEKGLIFYRGENVYALMNLFPYNSGHVLVCPYRHISLYEEMTEAERVELSDVTAKVLKALRQCFSPDGMNLGFNQGEIAGAGIAAHLHQHIVPRWSGDSNFFAIVGQTRAVPQLLEEQRSKLADYFRNPNV